MNRKLKAKWVAALLSEDYEQGQGLLRGDGKFCCLAVLRHVNDPNDKTKWWAKISKCELELLPLEKLIEFGLTGRIQEELAGLNDLDVPFPMIAGFIQENL